MEKKIRIRFANELWWDEIPFEMALKWSSFNVTYSNNECCFVIVDGTSMEMNIDDYNMIMENKLFALKFGVKKHTF